MLIEYENKLIRQTLTFSLAGYSVTYEQKTLSYCHSQFKLIIISNSF